MKNFEENIRRLQKANTKEEAFRYFNTMMNSYGYTNNVYTLMTDHPSIGEKAYHGLATTYPQDWLDHYNSHDYQAIDVVWKTLLGRTTPFFWSDVIDGIKLDPRLEEGELRAALRVMNEAQDAGVADGIGISFVNRFGEVAGIGLSKAKHENDHRARDLADIYLIASFFHEKFLSFYQKAPTPRLTSREREVLIWAAENKSDDDIGTILGVTSATVRFHWKNIFAKLGTHGRVASVIKAMRLQIINPYAIGTPYQG